ncbi:MAG: component of SufBCD complex [Paracoccaceae bacterium]
MTFAQMIFEVIDMRSFSNLWYWLMLAVAWSMASHFVLGVPFDMIIRARRHGGAAEADLHELVRINCARLLYYARHGGVWIVGFGMAFLTMLALLGFVYGIEFAQALFLLIFPLSFVSVLSMAAAEQIATTGLAGEALYRKLRQHRFITQLVGMFSLLVTALWGMYQNFTIGPFG